MMLQILCFPASQRNTQGHTALTSQCGNPSAASREKFLTGLLGDLDVSPRVPKNCLIQDCQRTRMNSLTRSLEPRKARPSEIRTEPCYSGEYFSTSYQDNSFYLSHSFTRGQNPFRRCTPQSIRDGIKVKVGLMVKLGTKCISPLRYSALLSVFCMVALALIV